MKAIQFKTLSREDNNATPPMHVSNNLDLKLGISSDDITDNQLPQKSRKRIFGFQQDESSSYKKSKTSVNYKSLAFGDYSYLFSQYSAGFVDPWSLAARQQKAVAEQAQFKLCNSNSSSIPMSLINISLSKQDESTNDSVLKTEKAIRPKLKRAMYVKVNIEGYVVGRKMNLTCHESYHSLSQALRNMFYNFLPNMQYDNSNAKDGDANDSDFILLYEDHEGDRMLVGDVPWELFITSVKRLYIARNSSAQEIGKQFTTDVENKDGKKEETTTI